MRTDIDETDPGETIIREAHRLDAEPEKVWRAVSESEFRAVWLHDQRVLDVLSEDPPTAIELLLEERNAPFARSVVRFGLSPVPGGTLLSILHRPYRVRAAGNDNAPMMRAA